MMLVLLRLWHWLVFGRTAKPIALALGNSGSPIVITETIAAGTVADIAFMIGDASGRVLPVGVETHICVRRALDVKPGTLRIVIERG